MSDIPPSPWFIDDESRNCRYYFRPLFDLYEEPIDVDDLQVETSLIDLEVIAAEKYDERGAVAQLYQLPESKRFNNRAWQLLQRDAALVEYLESTATQLTTFATDEAVMPTKSTAIENSSDSAAETISRMREQRRSNQAQEDNADRKTG